MYKRKVLHTRGLIVGGNGTEATELGGMTMFCSTIERGWSSTEYVHLMDTTRGAMAPFNAPPSATATAATASNAADSADGADGAAKSAATAPKRGPIRTEVYSRIFPFMDGIKVMRTEMCVVALSSQAGLALVSYDGRCTRAAYRQFVSSSRHTIGGGCQSQLVAELHLHHDVPHPHRYTSMAIAASLVFLICLVLLGRFDVSLLVFLMVVRCAFFDRILHSRMLLLDPTHVRFKRTCV
jgi:hypothetical protein